MRSTRNLALMAGLAALAVGAAALVAYLSPTGTRRAEGLVRTIRAAALTGDAEQGEAAYELLKDVGPAAVPAAGRLLEDRDPRVRACGAELVQELIEEVRERHPDGWTPVEVREAIPLLVAALKDGDEVVRSEAVSALGWVGPEAGAALPALRDALQDPSRRVQDKAGRALERIQAR